MFGRRDARTPLSNRDVALRVHGHWIELKRARRQGAGERELWHEDQMNEWLDVLCERRLLSRSTTWPESTSP